MQNKWLLSLLLALTCQSAGAAQKTKILDFPRAYPVGFIYVVPKAVELECNVKGLPIGRAQGRLVVPADKQLKFVPDHHFFEHPECLLKLPADAFDYIDLRFCSMDDGEEKMSDNAAAYVAHITGLKAISFDRSDTTDNGAAKVAAMPVLEGVSFTATMVNGTCLSALRNCKSLRFVRFEELTINNDMLKYLSQLPQLRRLTLRRVALTKAGLTEVSKCGQLINLDLGRNNNIDDSCLPLIAKMKKLEELALDETHVSLKGLLSSLSGLKLKNLALPFALSKYSAAEMALLHKTFPHADISGVGAVELGGAAEMLPPDPSKGAAVGKH